MNHRPTTQRPPRLGLGPGEPQLLSDDLGWAHCLDLWNTLEGLY